MGAKEGAALDELITLINKLYMASDWLAPNITRQLESSAYWSKKNCDRRNVSFEPGWRASAPCHLCRGMCRLGLLGHYRLLHHSPIHYFIVRRVLWYGTVNCDTVRHNFCIVLFCIFSALVIYYSVVEIECQNWQYVCIHKVLI